MSTVNNTLPGQTEPKTGYTLVITSGLKSSDIQMVGKTYIVQTIQEAKTFMISFGCPTVLVMHAPLPDYESGYPKALGAASLMGWIGSYDFNRMCDWMPDDFTAHTFEKDGEAVDIFKSRLKGHMELKTSSKRKRPEKIDFAIKPPKPKYNKETPTSSPMNFYQYIG